MEILGPNENDYDSEGKISYRFVGRWNLENLKRGVLLPEGEVDVGHISGFRLCLRP